MISFEDVSFTHDGAQSAILRDVDLTIPEGDLTLVIGRTGSGKSTFLNLINGLVPHFTGGTLRGRVTVAGMDTRTHPPRDLAGSVGTVGQSPRAGFTTDTVEDELAYTMESLGFAPDVMRRRVEETLDLLGLTTLRRRSLDTLSGGEQQRVAIGSALTAGPSVLVLDEPTSGLDPVVQQEFQRLVRETVDAGATVFLSSHVLAEVEEMADRVGIVVSGRLAVVDTVDTLRERAARKIELDFPAAPPDLTGAPGVQRVDVRGATATCWLTGPAGSLLKLAVDHGVVDIHTHEPDLEDAFLGYVTGEDS